MFIRGVVIVYNSNMTDDATEQPKRKRRWLRFSLRSFLIVVTILCVWMGWYVYRAQELHNAARQGARTAVYHENSNAEVESAVHSCLNNSMGLDPDAVTIRISRLTSSGEEQYQVMSLDENENGEAIRVRATLDYGEIGFATDILSLKEGTISSYAVMRRLK